MSPNGKLLQQFTAILLYAMSAFQLYTGFFGSMESYLQRVLHLFFALLLIFLLNPYSSKKRGWNIFLSGIFLITVVLSLGYILLNYEYVMTERFAFITPLTTTEMVLGAGLILLILESTRKMAGIALPLVALIFILYGFAGPYLPGILKHAGYTVSSIIDLNYFGSEGAFGIPLGASASYIALFIIFGAFLAKSGLGALLMDVALGLAGHMKGGPAKVAIFGSALHGMLSGSAVANVLTVGTSTIPLMKKIGYRAHFAGGVEAAASAGSQIMPPVMGVIAFVMAQYTGIPYIQIAGYALFPALLYYWGIWVMVHYEAVKLGLHGLPKHDLPDWKKSLKQRWHLLLPIAIMVILLMQDFSPGYAVSYSILSIVIVSAFRRETRMSIAQILDALKDGVKGMLMIAAATACAGMISGMFGLTGLGIRFTSLMDDMSGGSLLWALVLTAIAAFILGMGLPPSASYIVQVAITIPGIVGILEASSNEMIASNALLLSHMFVMYFASIAVITPPDALAAFAAAGIAQSRPLQTAFTATKLAFVAYIVPFLFVLNPAYLMIGNFTEILLAVATGILGVVAFGIASQGYIDSKIGWTQRTLAIVSVVMILIPADITRVLGIALIIFLLLANHLSKRKHTALKDIAS
ncbi:TRAP transporter permease [Cohnella kolymensis]|uniref:TRAP transporter permease n=1 Tax=Cohnella kolymensis TaxID=1590652 RepID=UPI000697E3AE|nr:TRAP transporter fused permease subunit [Cohnella kolymensis]